MGCVGSQFHGRSGSDPCEQRGQLQYCGQVRHPIAVGNFQLAFDFHQWSWSTNLIVKATSFIEELEVYEYYVGIHRVETEGHLTFHICLASPEVQVADFKVAPDWIYDINDGKIGFKTSTYSGRGCRTCHRHPK